MKILIVNNVIIIDDTVCFFLSTATMICGGLVMYPVGWDNREVRESCGKGANVYNLGEGYFCQPNNPTLFSLPHC